MTVGRGRATKEKHTMDLRVVVVWWFFVFLVLFYFDLPAHQ